MKNKLSRVALMVFDVDGVFADGSIIYAGSDTDVKIFNSKDGFAIAMARHANIKTAILTARHSKAAAARAAELKFDFYESGHFYKLEALKNIIAQAGVSPQDTLYMGDDVLDLICLPYAGIFAAPANAVARVRSEADLVTGARGGKGAVREIVDTVLDAKGILEQTENFFINGGETSP